MAIKERLERMPVVGTALAVQQRYTADAADPLAAAIAFFAFLSLFPLMLLAMSVVGFVLQDPADQLAIATAITEAIPGFQETLGEGEASPGVSDLVSGVVAQRGTVGVVGLVLLLFSGLRVVNAAMTATRVVFRGETPKGVVAKLWQIAALVVLGLVALAGVAGSSLAGVGLGGLPSFVVLLVSLGVSFVLDLLLFFAAYALLSPGSSLSRRQLLPGAILGAAGWTVLKVAGSAYVGGQVESANALYGALGGVIALLLLFYLAGRLYLYGAELSAVLAGLPASGPGDTDRQDATPASAGASSARASSAGASSAGASSAGVASARPRRGTAGRTAAAPGGAVGREVGGDGEATPRRPAARAGAESTAHASSVIREVAAGRKAMDAVREEVGAGRDVERDAQRAVAFVLAAVAVGAVWRWLGPGRQ